MHYGSCNNPVLLSGIFLLIQEQKMFLKCFIYQDNVKTRKDGRDPFFLCFCNSSNDASSFSTQHLRTFDFLCES